MSKTVVITNPGSGTAQKGEILNGFCAQAGWTLRETKTASDAESFAREAIGTFDTVVVAGGDGTLHSIVNGLGEQVGKVRLGLVPLGTGNDFARVIGVPEDPLEALTLILDGEERHLDLVKAQMGGREQGITTRYCVNVAAGGFSGQVEEALTDEIKALWGPLAYLRGAAGVLPNLTGYETLISWDGEHYERVESLNVIVANGRTAAKGFVVAPHANPEDGLLDVVIVRYAPLTDLVAVAARLVKGDYVDHDQVLYRKVAKISVASHPGMWFSLDGELTSNDPIAFSVLPKAMRFIVGPDYVSDPPPRE